jgi:hypothetical protein
MPEYRFYTLDPDGHIATPPTVVECQDDQTAVQRAKEALADLAIEVWESARLIARLET